MTHDPADVAIGDRLRRVRESRDRSQTDLAQAIGVTYQQVQKYETGKNRLSAARLMRAALYLQCTAQDILGPVTGVAPTEATHAVFDTPGGQTIAHIWRDLPPERREILIALAVALKFGAKIDARSA